MKFHSFGHLIILFVFFHITGLTFIASAFFKIVYSPSGAFPYYFRNERDALRVYSYPDNGLTVLLTWLIYIFRGETNWVI